MLGGSKVKEILKRLGVDSEVLHSPCKLCSVNLEEEEVVECPRCHSHHHLSCWKTKGGCAKRGCPQLAEVFKGEKPKGDGPPPPISKKSLLGGIALFLLIVLGAMFWPKPPEPWEGRIKITFMAEGSIVEQSLLETLAEDFNALQEEIYLHTQILPYGTMEMKLMVLLAANDTPDIFTMNYERFPIYVHRELLLPLKEEEEEILYGIEHPAQHSMMGIMARTPNEKEARSVLAYLLDAIPPLDLETLPAPFFPSPTF